MGLIYDLFSRNIFWEPFKIVCYVSFISIIIMYLFNPAWATLMLFGYLALWSRITPLISDWTKDLDMVDFFAVIIAVNLDSPFAGLYAGFFSVFVMMFSRVFGPDEDISITVTESTAFFFASLLTPAVFLATNNILITMFTFTAMRYLFDMIIVTLFFRHLFFLAILSIILGVPIAYIMNKTLIIFLGPFLSGVFTTGLGFNFPLFLLAAILTVSVHYIEKYMRKNDYITETKMSLKENYVQSIVNDNIVRYPEFY